MQPRSWINDTNWPALTPQIPTMAVAFVACIVALVLWRQAPRAWLLALIGFGLRLLLPFVHPFVNQFMLDVAPGQLWVAYACAIGLSFVNAASIVCLVCAIFASRTPRARQA